MTTLSGPRDYHEDVANPEFRAAEELFREACPWPCRDNRDAHEPWDFWVVIDGWEYSLDVKNDLQMHRWRRVAFELCHEYADGRVVDGWGRHPELDLVAYVPETKHVAYVHSVPLIRDHIGAHESEWKRRGWATFAPGNLRWSREFNTHGYAIPMAELEAAGTLIAVIPLDAKGIRDGVD